MENKYERLLEAHFAGMLSQAEQDEMKALLASDPDFAAELAWRQSVARAVRTGTEKDPTYLKLKELERRFRFRKVIMQISAVAASLVLLISVVLFFPTSEFFQNKNQVAVNQDTLQTPNPALQTPAPQIDSTALKAAQEESEKKQAQEELQRQKEEQRKQRILRDSMKNAVVANFKHYRNLSPLDVASGGVEEKDTMAMRAFILYDDKKYTAAAEAFKPVVEAEPSNMEYQFYYAFSLLGAEQYAASAKAFQPVTEKLSKYQVPAKFHLGMAHYGAGHYNAGQKAFREYLDAPNNNRQFKGLAEKMLTIRPPQ